MWPTGSGKSAIYITCSVIIGCVVVVEPLVATVADQVLNISRLPAKSIKVLDFTSHNAQKFEQIKKNEYNLIYVVPEGLDSLMQVLPKQIPKLIVIDEAHTLYTEFTYRCAFSKVCDFVRKMQVPVVAMTATASDPIQKHITH